MKTFQKALLTLIAGSAMSMVAQANIYTQGAGTPYVGAKVGQTNISVGAGSSSKPMAYGVVAGFEFTPNISAELEYMKSGKADYNYNGANGEVDAKTYGAYGAYRYFMPNSNFYGKGKLGLAKTDTEAHAGSYRASSSTTAGPAGAVGVGFQPNENIAVEAEYSRANSDVGIISLGANLKF